ncbi:unnamed protein product (macronuclear) [Paramecium tetraurelia]|uniref:Protein kinase domain-containing protein n=1 Tax=Paramecium tetraurelia TaxID=5888 RepID=A0CU23_PARTE|nr:uncharacterized protein GSPATT00010489001 [Paramecium tetraurelia]CAK74290.1 unnamed protein product [Paramecium tetraurelia]|eukprot:XP_001441687.1 hypothetical protein (macronuclear) [Paramecium tetraurelia strain d4-2]
MIEQLPTISLCESTLLEQPLLSSQQSYTEKKCGSRFQFIKCEQEDKQYQAENNRNRIKQQLKGRLQLIIKKPSYYEKNSQEELQELGQKLDVEFSDLDSLYICADTKKFDQEYEMMEILGEGCLGLVKRIINKQTKEEYAVKIVQTQDDEIIRNMIIEFKSLQKLNHDNIVKVHRLYIDFNNGFQSESKAYAIMELVKGQEMFEVINKLGHYSESVAKELFKQLLSAIEYMHRNGICHRDLKPNNILCVENKQQIKVTDFNVSKFSDTYKEFGDLKDREKIEMWTYTGTVAFSAPEIFTGEGYNQMVDMWSAGCILYSMLSGQLPFISEYLNDLIEQIKEAQIQFPDELFKQISKEAKDLVSQLLQKDSSQRLQPDAALKHPWFENVVLEQDIEPFLNLAILNNIPRLSSKYSRNNQKSRSILLKSSQNTDKSNLLQSEFTCSPTKFSSKKNNFFSNSVFESQLNNQGAIQNDNTSITDFANLQLIKNTSNISEDISDLQYVKLEQFIVYKKNENQNQETQQQ